MGCDDYWGCRTMRTITHHAQTLSMASQGLWRTPPPVGHSATNRAPCPSVVSPDLSSIAVWDCCFKERTSEKHPKVPMAGGLAMVKREIWPHIVDNKDILVPDYSKASDWLSLRENHMQACPSPVDAFTFWVQLFECVKHFGCELCIFLSFIKPTYKTYR